MWTRLWHSSSFYVPLWLYTKVFYLFSLTGSCFWLCFLFIAQGRTLQIYLFFITRLVVKEWIKIMTLPGTETKGAYTQSILRGIIRRRLGYLINKKKISFKKRPFYAAYSALVWTLLKKHFAQGNWYSNKLRQKLSK